MKIKITGYTILKTLIVLLGIYGLYSIEIFLYNYFYIKISKQYDLIAYYFFNLMITVIVFFILQITDSLEWLDKILKKRII